MCRKNDRIDHGEETRALFVRSEQRRGESEERFRGVFEHAPFGMCRRRAGRALHPGECGVLPDAGIFRTGTAGQTWTELTHPDDLGHPYREGSSCGGPGRMRGCGNTLHSPQWNCGVGARKGLVGARLRRQPAIFCGPRGRHHGTQAGGRRRCARVKSVSASWRTVARRMMWVTNAEGGNQFINRAYREFCGTTYEQVEGGKWQLLIHPDDAPEYVGAFQRAVREHAPFRAEARVRRADGEWRLMASYAEPRLSPGASSWGMSASVRTSPSASRPSKPCRAAKRSFASWRKTFVKSFG